MPVGAVGSQTGALLHAALQGCAQHGVRILLWVIAQTLRTHSHGAANMDKTTLSIGAIAFIHRFGSSLN
jgi:hypothetical protein